MKRTLITLLILFNIAHMLTQTAFAQAGNLSEAQITELVDGDLKTASKLIAREIEASPEDPELHKIAGDIFAVRAQNASIFSAPGLAKKILKSYKQAVKLAPQNTEYRMSLMQFYLFAPGIVGGDKKLGLEQVAEIKKLDSASGVVADSFMLLKSKDEEALEALFAGLSPALQAQPKVKMAQATYLRNTDQFNLAYNVINELIELPSQDLPQQQSLIPYKAMLQAGFLAMKSEAHRGQGIDAFKRYLATAPSTYKLTSKKWVNLFLGQLYTTTGQTELAKSTLLAAKENTTDKSLLSEIDDALKKI